MTAITAANFMTLIMLFFMFVLLIVNRKADIPGSKLVWIVIGMLLVLVVLEEFEDVLRGNSIYQLDIEMSTRVTLSRMTAALLYTLRPIVILLELLLICPSKRLRIPIIIPAVINTAIYFPSVFGAEIAFRINEKNYWGAIMPFNLTIYIVMLLYVASLLFFSIWFFRAKERKVSLIVLSIFIVSVIDAVLEYTSVLTGNTNAIIALCTLVYYVYLSMVYQQRIQQALAEKEMAILQSEVLVLKNQMHPHFIYNALATIRLLAKKDGTKAVKCIDDFSKYLRSHIGAIQSDDMIPFLDELENVKVYLSIVQESFNSSIEIVYEFETTDFKLPPLSLEPIVENAVNHGISRLGGTITIKTLTDERNIIVRVKDSGSSDVPPGEYTPYHNGIGLDNVTKRLELQCGGSLRTDFSNNGSTVDIILPAVTVEEENK